MRGKEVALAPKEFGLLRVLMENHGRVVTRQTLLDKVWGYDFEGEQQTVSVHIRWLREKIEEDSRAPRHILTVRSRGYMFKAVTPLGVRLSPLEWSLLALVAGLAGGFAFARRAA